MRALICSQFGFIDDLNVGTLPMPSFGGDEILIKTNFCGLNFPDTLIVQGKYQFRPDFPFSPGQEVSGIVESVGESVSGLKKGDEVLASMTFGGVAEYAVAKATNTYLLPGEVSMKTASAILESFATAFHALKDRAMMKPGQTLAVMGASGGTGLAAIQLGKLFGCKVIAVCSTEPKRTFAKKLGADEAISYENLKDELKSLGGIDVIFDPVGGDYSEQAFRALKPEGKLLVIGFASGKVPAIPLNLPLLKSAEIVGVYWGGFWRKSADQNRKNVQMILKWFEQEKLTLPEPTIIPLDNAVDAFNLIANRKAIGKVILEV